MGAILIVIGDFAMWRERPTYPYLLSVGVAFLAFAFAAPSALKPLQKAWMALGIFLGFFVSRIVISVLFFGVVTPTGLIMRLFGKDILDERIDKSRASYWQERPSAVKDKKSYENQY
jgi:polyferredoxin